jgi:hypothetical protein
MFSCLYLLTRKRPPNGINFFTHPPRNFSARSHTPPAVGNDDVPHWRKKPPKHLSKQSQKRPKNAKKTEDSGDH